MDIDNLDEKMIDITPIEMKKNISGGSKVTRKNSKKIKQDET